MALLHLMSLTNDVSFPTPPNCFDILFLKSWGERKRERSFWLLPNTVLRWRCRVREVAENPWSGGTNQLTDRSSLQDTTLKHRSLHIVEVKRRRNTTAGVSSVIVGHEAAATLVLLQALLANKLRSLSLLVSVPARIGYHRTVKNRIASLCRFEKSISGTGELSDRRSR